MGSPLAVQQLADITAKLTAFWISVLEGHIDRSFPGYSEQLLPCEIPDYACVLTRCLRTELITLHRGRSDLAGLTLLVPLHC